MGKEFWLVLGCSRCRWAIVQDGSFAGRLEVSGTACMRFEQWVCNKRFGGVSWNSAAMHAGDGWSQLEPWRVSRCSMRDFWESRWLHRPWKRETGHAGKAMQRRRVMLAARPADWATVGSLVGLVWSSLAACWSGLSRGVGCCAWVMEPCGSWEDRAFREGEAPDGASHAGC